MDVLDAILETNGDASRAGCQDKGTEETFIPLQRRLDVGEHVSRARGGGVQRFVTDSMAY